RTVCRDASGFSPNHVHVIPNGVDVNRFRPAKLPESDPAEITIGFVGSLKPWHGVDFLLEAFLRLHCECQNVRLHIIGDGPMRESLQQSAAAFPATVANSIEFRAVVSPEDMPEHLNRLDIAVAPYGDTRESWFSPLKVYEYMACGLAVVASATGQLCDLVEDGVNGLLVPPGDCEQLATALTSLVRSAELRHHLGVAARQTVVRNHSWDHTLETILATVNNDRDEIQNSDRKRESQFPPELSCGTALRMMN
ncbi:MAG: glycosyltransferase family 4 protein, partial [Planctomycetaceae bacterium]|nr:glycosyltransferase family 4 protein [Planctomycetaceae bacterium]